MAESTNFRSAALTDADALALAKVRDALNGLRYGQVTVVVQDGVVVQVERTEKVRIKQ